MRRSLLAHRLFADRTDAGRRLAARLERYRGTDTVVLALPRGGVVVAYEVARALGAPLDVIVVRKLGAPQQPELGIGAIAPGGVRLLDERSMRMLGITEAAIERVVARETVELERRLARYRDGRAEPDLHGHTVILVDDGLATGVSARAAIESVKRAEPARLVLAAPVCAPETAGMLRAEVDDVVCVDMPPDFYAVGLWYDNFDQTSDEEVVELLRRADRERGDVSSSG